MQVNMSRGVGGSIILSVPHTGPLEDQRVAARAAADQWISRFDGHWVRTDEGHSIATLKWRFVYYPMPENRSVRKIGARR